MKLRYFVLSSSLIALSGTAGWLVAAEPSPSAPYQHQLQATESCEACHARERVDVFKSTMADDCNQCHASGDDAGQGGLIRAADTAEQPSKKKYSDIYAEKLKVAPPPEATAGMSVPWYYEETRIGADPNEMIYVPAGEYIRGSNSRLPDEGPEQKVTTKAFWIDKYEVTNLQYKKFIEATKRRSPDHFRNRTYPAGKVDHPVTWVTWFDAKAYCEWAGKRLPSDIEWEKAGRGTDGRNFPWGDEFDPTRVNSPVRWKSLNMEGDTTPVGSFEGGKGPYGLYDMSGNVWEWTDSWYTQYPGNTWPSENYGEIYKTLKGGSWWDCSFYQCGVSAPMFNRSYFKPNVKNSSFGFRCAKDAEQ
ncbi:MAG: SUMF1/EgtB/PvdO family nonheme iron enzyme [Pseudomonadota bacterium]